MKKVDINTALAGPRVNVNLTALEVSWLIAKWTSQMRTSADMVGESALTFSLEDVEDAHDDLHKIYNRLTLLSDLFITIHEIEHEKGAEKAAQPASADRGEAGVRPDATSPPPSSDAAETRGVSATV